MGGYSVIRRMIWDSLMMLYCRLGAIPVGTVSVEERPMATTMSAATNSLFGTTEAGRGVVPGKHTILLPVARIL